MAELSIGDTAGILLIAVVLFAAAYFLSGVLQYVAAFLGVVVLGLWIFNAFAQGYAEGSREE